MSRLRCNPHHTIFDPSLLPPCPALPCSAQPCPALTRPRHPHLAQRCGGDGLPVKGLEQHPHWGPQLPLNDCLGLVSTEGGHTVLQPGRGGQAAGGTQWVGGQASTRVHQAAQEAWMRKAALPMQHAGAVPAAC